MNLDELRAAVERINAEAYALRRMASFVVPIKYSEELRDAAERLADIAHDLASAAPPRSGRPNDVADGLDTLADSTERVAVERVEAQRAAQK